MVNKFKYLVIGIMIGMALGGGIAWAAMQRTILISPDERPLGTAENPLYIQ